jgi:2-amino-4-hydroxy-6-hydroxymethyldihydropteridine diphosphokinase
MIRGFLSFGSNLGNRGAYLKEALERLHKKGVKIIKRSCVYETLPVEVHDEQGNFFNMVVEFSFEGDPMKLLDLCQEVEDSLGRARPYIHSPRTIDIDILFIHGVSVVNERLIVPHPRMENRAFVIYPLAEIAPELILPSGRMVTRVKKSFKKDEILKIQDG